MKRRHIYALSALAVVITGIAVYAIIFIKPPAGNNRYSKLEYNQGITQGSNIFPGEFEKQQAIWLQWPSEIYNTGAYPVNPVMVKMIKALDPYIRVNVMTRSTDEIIRVRNLLKSSGYTGINAHFYIINHMSIWTRDVGPIFVKDSRYMTNVVDFGFNNYSRDGNEVYINT
jgi:agmatine deiminase